MEQKGETRERTEALRETEQATDVAECSGERVESGERVRCAAWPHSGACRDRERRRRGAQRDVTGRDREKGTPRGTARRCWDRERRRGAQRGVACERSERGVLRCAAHERDMIAVLQWIA